MTIELTPEEQQFLINIMLKEIEMLQKTKQTFNVFNQDDAKAKYFKDSFWQLDTFTQSIYKKLVG